MLTKVAGWFNQPLSESSTFFPGLYGIYGCWKRVSQQIRLFAVSKGVSAVVVPLIVVQVGFLIQQSIAKQSPAKDYVALAIEVLKSDSVAYGSTGALRQWAVDVLTVYSPVPIPHDAQLELRNRVIVFPVVPAYPKLNPSLCPGVSPSALLSPEN